jgi:hypothetical protein
VTRLCGFRGGQNASPAKKFIAEPDQSLSHKNSDKIQKSHLTGCRFWRISSRASGLAELRPSRFQAVLSSFQPSSDSIASKAVSHEKRRGFRVYGVAE